MRCDAMQCDAMRCNASEVVGWGRCDAMRWHANRNGNVMPGGAMHAEHSPSSVYTVAVLAVALKDW